MMLETRTWRCYSRTRVLPVALTINFVVEVEVRKRDYFDPSLTKAELRCECSKKKKKHKNEISLPNLASLHVRSCYKLWWTLQIKPLAVIHTSMLSISCYLRSLRIARGPQSVRYDGAFSSPFDERPP